MGLSQSQKSLIEKARTLGSGSDRFALDDQACVYLLAVIAHDLGFDHHFPEFPKAQPDFFSNATNASIAVPSRFADLAARLFGLDENADTYFACLANLHKRRLKYHRILSAQPLPTIDQVGPRGLLQYGDLSARALASLLFWRKWIYDIDNRAAQETGYLFEPIIAHAIGGTPVSAKQSPIKRETDSGKGRQVDCILGKDAYEFKLRVTIAASGQGRWAEELQFPRDCSASGYTPWLIVLDPTDNAKLGELSAAFESQGGVVLTGESAWKHLDEKAGPTMARFLDTYVREPLEALLTEADEPLAEMSLKLEKDCISIAIGSEELRLARTSIENGDVANDPARDASDQLPGVG